MPGTSTHRHPKGFDIVFDEATHTYTTTFVAPAIPGHPTPQHVVKYTSGTTFIHKFTPPFDKDGKIAERKARERGVSPDQIRFEWKQKGVEATEMGTRVTRRARTSCTVASSSATSRSRRTSATSCPPAGGLASSS